MAIKRLKTGIPGFDEVMKGGIRENSSVLISGGPGTGKSIFTMQFLLEGAKKGEQGLFILYDTGEEDFLDYADSLGIPIRKYVDSGVLDVVKQAMLIRKTPSLAIPLEIMRKKKVKRVALDSLTMFAYIHASEKKNYRREIVNFLEHMRDVTLIATSESNAMGIDTEEFNPEDFLFDGVILLTKVRQEAAFERVLHVTKMRGQDHLMNVFPFFIQEKGIQVYPDQIPFALIAGDQSFNSQEKTFQANLVKKIKAEKKT